MGAKSGIEWTDSTWNPIRGCSPVSEGCKNCYAAGVAGRFSFAGGPFEGLVRLNAAGQRMRQWNGQVRLIEKHLLDPLKWGLIANEDDQMFEVPGVGSGMTVPLAFRARRIFVNSVSDLFHEEISLEWLFRIFDVIAGCPHHVFQVLTKRAAKMRTQMGLLPRYVKEHHEGESSDLEIAIDAGAWPLKNLWLGVSVENQAAADERIPLLLETPAAKRFVSCEPLLGPVSLCALCEEIEGYWDSLCGLVVCDGRGGKETAALDWVICGGESGPHARPMHPDWVRMLHAQCQVNRVPFFFKQWGEWSEVEKEWPDEEFSPRMVRQGDCFVTSAGCFDILGSDLSSRYEADGLPMRRVGKPFSGSRLDGAEYKQFPVVR